MNKKYLSVSVLLGIGVSAVVFFVIQQKPKVLLESKWRFADFQAMYVTFQKNNTRESFVVGKDPEGYFQFIDQRQDIIAAKLEEWFLKINQLKSLPMEKVAVDGQIKNQINNQEFIQHLKLKMSSYEYQLKTFLIQGHYLIRGSKRIYGKAKSEHFEFYLEPLDAQSVLVNSEMFKSQEK
jgi:hypothetical protein